MDVYPMCMHYPSRLIQCQDVIGKSFYRSVLVIWDRPALPPAFTPWIPPPKGEFKLNFDATFGHGTTYTGVVLRNEFGVVLGAWTNCFQSENSFCAETATAVQTLKIAH